MCLGICCKSEIYTNKHKYSQLTISCDIERDSNIHQCKEAQNTFLRLGHCRGTSGKKLHFLSYFLASAICSANVFRGGGHSWCPSALPFAARVRLLTGSISACKPFSLARISCNSSWKFTPPHVQLAPSPPPDCPATRYTIPSVGTFRYAFGEKSIPIVARSPGACTTQ